MSHFSEHHSRALAAQAEASRRREEDDALQEHLLGISDDYSGSRLEDYLNPGDIESCRDFLALAGESGFPNAEKIDMQVRLVEGRLAWRRPRGYASRAFNKLDHRTVWSGLGYHIGKLALGIGETKIMLSPLWGEEGTTEGEIRCARHPNVFSQSYGLGYGVMPHLPKDRLPIKLPDLSRLFSKYLMS